MRGFGFQSHALSGAVCVRLALLLIALGATACRSGINTKNKRSTQESPAPADAPPHGEPVEVPGSFTSTRSVYQSRSVIALDVKSSALQLGDEFSLVNETTGAVLIQQESPKLMLTGYDDIGWHLDGYDFTLNIYLLSPEFTHGFIPGANNLQLHVSKAEDESGRIAKTLVTLTDFPVFGEATGVFESGEQRSGGFEGSFVPFANSVATSKGKGFLVTGFISIVNK